MKRAVVILLTGTLLGACSPTIKMEAPDKPLEVNMNVKIEHTIKVQVDKQLESVMEENEDIF